MHDSDVSAASRTDPSNSRRTTSRAPGDAAAWFREVERARWAAQPRYEADLPSGTRPSEQVEGQASCGTCATHAANAYPPEVRTANQHNPQVNSEARVSVSDFGIHEDIHRGETLGGIAGTQNDAFKPGSSMRMEEGEHAAMLPTRSEEARATTRAKWQPFAVHVERHEDGLSVWVRDSRMGAQDALRLLERLSREFSNASATSSDSELRLTLNGQPVSRGDEHLPEKNQRKKTSHGY